MCDDLHASDGEIVRGLLICFDPLSNPSFVVLDIVVSMRAEKKGLAACQQSAQEE
jgi:hypothetical protein